MTKQRKLLSQRHPIFYFVSVWEKRIRKRISWMFDGKKYTKSKKIEKLDFRVKKHQSKLLKKLGDTDMILQYNKIDNLKLVIERVNGTLIKPWGGWKYDIKQTKNSLLKRLETLWKHYEKYSPKIYEFHFLSVVEWAGVNDSNALMKRRKKVLNKGYNFFANEMDFKIFLACLNHKQGHIELANQYVDETQKLLDEGRASPQLKKRIKQGLTYVQKNTKNYPEITTIYSNRLKRK